MSNRDLIERLRDAQDMAVSGSDRKMLKSAADALAAADKRIAELEATALEVWATHRNVSLLIRAEEAERRIAELEAKLNQSVEIIEAFKKLHEPRMHLMLDPRVPELERELAIAREALGIATTYSMLESNRKTITEALAQIGGEDDSKE